MVLDKEEKVCYVLEFKRELERHGGAQEKARQRAEQQHGNLVRGLSKALEGSEWRVTLIVFVGELCGSVEEKAFNANMELLGVIESERNAIRKRHVWKLLEEQDRVLRRYYAQLEGFDRGGQGTQGQTGLGREHVGHGVHIYFVSLAAPSAIPSGVKGKCLNCSLPCPGHNVQAS